MKPRESSSVVDISGSPGSGYFRPSSPARTTAVCKLAANHSRGRKVSLSEFTPANYNRLSLVRSARRRGGGGVKSLEDAETISRFRGTRYNWEPLPADAVKEEPPVLKSRFHPGGLKVERLRLRNEATRDSGSTFGTPPRNLKSLNSKPPQAAALFK